MFVILAQNAPVQPRNSPHLPKNGFNSPSHKGSTAAVPRSQLCCGTGVFGREEFQNLLYGQARPEL